MANTESIDQEKQATDSGSVLFDLTFDGGLGSVRSRFCCSEIARPCFCMKTYFWAQKPPYVCIISRWFRMYYQNHYSCP